MKDEQPGPPFNLTFISIVVTGKHNGLSAFLWISTYQMVVSLEAFSLVLGKYLCHISIEVSCFGRFGIFTYQKNSCRVSLSSFEMGIKPAYDSPRSQSTKGISVPLTKYSKSLY